MCPSKPYLQTNIFSSLYFLVCQMDREDLTGYSQKLPGDARATWWNLQCPVTTCFVRFWTESCTLYKFSSVQSLSRVWLCDPLGCSTPGLSVHHQLLEPTQTHVHRLGDAIQPSHPLSSPSPAFNLSQHQGLFQWVGSLHQVAKVLEFQLEHQSFQWIFRTDFL